MRSTNIKWVLITQSHSTFQLGIGHASAVIQNGNATSSAIPNEIDSDFLCSGRDAVVDDVSQCRRR